MDETTDNTPQTKTERTEIEKARFREYMSRRRKDPAFREREYILRRERNNRKRLEKSDPLQPSPAPRKYHRKPEVKEEEETNEETELDMDVYGVEEEESADVHYENSVYLDNAEPNCHCNEIPSLRKLSGLFKGSSLSECQRLESGLSRFIENFTNSPPEDDSFNNLIISRLAKVSEDHRPDLEVTILRAINEALKLSNR